MELNKPQLDSISPKIKSLPGMEYPCVEVKTSGTPGIAHVFFCSDNAARNSSNQKIFAAFMKRNNHYYTELSNNKIAISHEALYEEFMEN